MRKNQIRDGAEQGFTIIELMIATAVLATIILLATVLIISIGNLYYKGINQSRVQDATRSIVDEISQDLQLSNTTPSPSDPTDPSNTFDGVTVSAYCIDTTRYSYVLGTEIGQKVPGSNTVLQHVLWRDTIPAGSACTAANLTLATPSSGGTELISPLSRLANFTITGTGPTYTLLVYLAYGDDTLLNNPHGTSPTCLGNIGDQFCSTAQLTITVSNRLTDGSY